MDELNSLTLLFVEDNEEFANNTTVFLSLYFKKVVLKKNIKEAIVAFNDIRIDAIITDVKLEDGNGLDFITQVRHRDKNIPIIVLSAHKDESFLFKAIGLNISSYELKPIGYENFISILKNLSLMFKPQDIVEISNEIKYDYKMKELLRDNDITQLTKKEALFIELLIINRDEITTNAIIQRDIWGDKLMSDSAIKNLVLRLRKKTDSNFIVTVTGIGYKLLLK